MLVRDFALTDFGPPKAALLQTRLRTVGQGWVTNASFHVFLYSGGRMVDLGGGFQASASAINGAGKIVGNGTTVGAFLYSNC